MLKRFNELIVHCSQNYDYQYVIDESPDLEKMIAETENTLNVKE
jgi:hypothetical protein